MRYSIRTLLILMLLAGPLSALGWKQWLAYRERLALAQMLEQAAQDRQLRRRQFDAQIIALLKAAQTQPTPTAAELEIWEAHKNNFNWESFPESQPPTSNAVSE